jgi:hypothetical protein
MPEGEQRENVLRIRLTPEERRILDDVAQLKKLPTSKWARDIILGVARRQSNKKALDSEPLRPKNNKGGGRAD